MSDSQSISHVHHASYFNTAKAILNAVKLILIRRSTAYEKAHRLQSERSRIKQEIMVAVGSSDEISTSIDRYIDTMLKFFRWQSFFGKDIMRFLPIHKPNGFRLLSKITGIDLSKEIHITDDACIFDGIKFVPRAGTRDIEKLLNECPSIIFGNYLRRKFENFDSWCEILGWQEGPYEYGNVFLEEGDTVFDCGANRGAFSAVASRYGGQVFSFEAMPHIIDNHLSKTASLNENIRVCNYAVWDKEETLEFSLMLHYLGASRCNQFVTKKQARRKTVKQVSVPAITLDAFVERNGIQRVDFIKADIEGAERNMLRGAGQILKEFTPKLSICTYHLPDDPQVLREIILDINPKYQIVEKFWKMYAWVPNK